MFRDSDRTVRERRESRRNRSSRKTADEDFTTLEKHAKEMSQVLDIPVDYIDDTFGPAARESISNLDSGDNYYLRMPASTLRK